VSGAEADDLGAGGFGLEQGVIEDGGQRGRGRESARGEGGGVEGRGDGDLEAGGVEVATLLMKLLGADGSRPHCSIIGRLRLA
jgi:hypothetical protein